MLCGSLDRAVYVAWVTGPCCLCCVGHWTVLFMLCGSLDRAVYVVWVTGPCCLCCVGHWTVLFMLRGSLDRAVSMSRSSFWPPWFVSDNLEGI